MSRAASPRGDGATRRLAATVRCRRGAVGSLWMGTAHGSPSPGPSSVVTRAGDPFSGTYPLASNAGGLFPRAPAVVVPCQQTLARTHYFALDSRGPRCLARIIRDLATFTRCGIGLVSARSHVTPGLPIFRTPEPPTRNILMVIYDNSCVNSQDSVRTTRTESSRAPSLSWAALMMPVDSTIHLKVAHTSRFVRVILAQGPC